VATAPASELPERSNTVSLIARLMRAVERFPHSQKTSCSATAFQPGPWGSTAAAVVPTSPDSFLRSPEVPSDNQRRRRSPRRVPLGAREMTAVGGLLRSYCPHRDRAAMVASSRGSPWNGADCFGFFVWPVVSARCFR
jgi:hypothetical protein